MKATIHRFGRAVAAFLATALVLTHVSPASALLLDHEYLAAYSQLGQMRMLTQRLSKQNLLYQLHLADQHKLQLLETVGEINEALGMLRAGSPMIGVPAPPNAELRDQLEAISQAWVPLETMALASPYDYLRRSREFINPRSDRGDPLLIVHFDRMARDLDAQIIRARELYIASCKQDGYRRCDLGNASRLQETRAERLVKEVVLVFAGMDAETNKTRMAATRAALEEVLFQTGTTPEMADAKAVMSQALDPSQTPQSAQIAQLRDDIRASWRRLEREINLVEKGHAEEANLRRALSIQQLMVSDMQRLGVAIERTTDAGTLR